MKKKYQKPTISFVPIKFEHGILVGSATVDPEAPVNEEWEDESETIIIDW